MGIALVTYSIYLITLVTGKGTLILLFLNVHFLIRHPIKTKHNTETWHTDSEEFLLIFIVKIRNMRQNGVDKR